MVDDAADVKLSERRLELTPHIRWAWLFWLVASGLYFLAFFHRAAFGVAGLEVEQRFGISATELGSFVLLQLACYALMQLPTGVLLDRFGSRRVLLAAALVMGVAQVILALSPSFVLALIGRGLLGIGDAMVFISVLRHVAVSFTVRLYPLLSSITGIFGMAGNLVATVPLTLVLEEYGWTPAFLIPGVITLVYAAFFVRDFEPVTTGDTQSDNHEQIVETAPEPSTVSLKNTQLDDTEKNSSQGATAGIAQAFSSIKTVWKMPAARLGLWVHMATMSATTTFGFLWGFPFLTQAVGLTSLEASTILLAISLAGLLGALLLGSITTKWPSSKFMLAVVISLIALGSWIGLVISPQQLTFPTALFLAVSLSIGGPASQLAFMIVRDYVPSSHISTATGMANMGGFGASLVYVILIGVVLDIVRHTTDYSDAVAFQIAFLAMVPLMLVGFIEMFIWRRKLWRTLLA